MAKPRSRTRKRPTNATTNPAVEESINRIRQFHALGKDTDARKALSPLLEGKSDLTKTEYQEKANRFADSKRGYSTADLAELFDQCRKFGFLLGTTHVFCLLSVEDHKKRRALQKAMVEEHWTRTRLCAEIAKLNQGKGSHAGRPVKRPVDRDEAKYSSERVFEHAYRVFRRALQTVAAEQHDRSRKRKKVPGEDLARQLCRHIHKITGAILEGDPPPPAISAEMRSRIEQLKAKATVSDK